MEESDFISEQELEIILAEGIAPRSNSQKTKNEYMQNIKGLASYTDYSKLEEDRKEDEEMDKLLRAPSVIPSSWEEVENMIEERIQTMTDEILDRKTFTIQLGDDEKIGKNQTLQSMLSRLMSSQTLILSSDVKNPATGKLDKNRVDRILKGASLKNISRIFDSVSPNGFRYIDTKRKKSKLVTLDDWVEYDKVKQNCINCGQRFYGFGNTGTLDCVTLSETRRDHVSHNEIEGAFDYNRLSKMIQKLDPSFLEWSVFVVPKAVIWHHNAPYMRAPTSTKKRLAGVMKNFECPLRSVIQVYDSIQDLESYPYVWVEWHDGRVIKVDVALHYLKFLSGVDRITFMEDKTGLEMDAVRLLREDPLVMIKRHKIPKDRIFDNKKFIPFVLISRVTYDRAYPRDNGDITHKITNFVSNYLV